MMKPQAAPAPISNNPVGHILDRFADELADTLGMLDSIEHALMGDIEKTDVKPRDLSRIQELDLAFQRIAAVQDALRLASDQCRETWAIDANALAACVTLGAFAARLNGQAHAPENAGAELGEPDFF